MLSSNAAPQQAQNFASSLTCSLHEEQILEVIYRNEKIDCADSFAKERIDQCDSDLSK
jgi:hypothetical protein